MTIKQIIPAPKGLGVRVSNNDGTTFYSVKVVCLALIEDKRGTRIIPLTCSDFDQKSQGIFVVDRPNSVVVDLTV